MTQSSESKSTQLQAKLSLTEPESTAIRALEALFLKAKGEDWHTLFSAKPNSYLGDVGPAKGGQAAATRTYARLIRQHVENLNSLIATHSEFLLPYSQTCFTWPILKSKHPGYSDDERSILSALEVGERSGRYFTVGAFSGASATDATFTFIAIGN